MTPATQLNRTCGEPERILIGEVSDISLPTLLHLLEIENVTGWLHLGGEAEIRFHKGHVVDASLGPYRRLVAIREILFREGWSFEVVRGQTEPGQPMHKLPFAMMDAFHLRSEWRRIERDVYRLVGDQRWCPTGREVDALMDRLDGKRTLSEHVAASTVPTTIAVETILEALTLGLIEKVDLPEKVVDDGELASREGSIQATQAAETTPEQSPPATTGLAPEAASLIADADFDDLLVLARRSKREGDLATALAAIRAALKLSPESRVAKQNLRRLIELRGE